MLFARVVVAVVGVPAVLALAAGGVGPFLLFLLAVGFLAQKEWGRLTAATGAAPHPELLYGAGLLLLIGAYAGGETGVAAVAGAAVAYALLRGMLRPGRAAIRRLTWSVAGALYTGGLLAFLLLLVGLRRPPWGEGGLLLLLVPVWVTDVAAFTVGRLAGRRPLAPRLSPKKTWEGAVAGYLAGGVAALAGGRLLGMAGGAGALLALLLPAAAIAGDLAESALKRAAGVKDSSRLLPGHGGVLDRLDSLLPGAPLVYLLLARAG